MKMALGPFREMRKVLELSVIVAACGFAFGFFGASAIQIVRAGDLEAYRDFAPSADTLKFQAAVASVQRVDVGGAPRLTGWKARDFARHVRFEGLGEFCTCSSDPPNISFIGANGKELAQMNFIFGEGDGTVQLQGVSGITSFMRLQPGSAKYLQHTRNGG